MDRGGTLLHGRQHFRTITFLFYPSHHQGPGIFKDWTASQLADDFKNKQLKQFQSPTMRQLAEQLKKGTYESRYLLNSYSPIPSNKILEEKLKLYNGYSRYENITGVYLEKARM